MYIRSRLFLLLSVIVFLCSCGTRKHRYLQVYPKTADQEAIYQKSLEEYHLQPNDILFIKVLTEKGEYQDMFNTTMSQQQTSSTMSGPYLYLSGYPIDVMGDIEMPLIGKVHVAGLTTAEIEKIVHENISKIVYDSQVIVRLAGFRINIVGEVKSPGEFTVYREHATILEALSLAGDVNYYSNRKEIMVVRSTPEGFVTHTIDLTDRKALSSPVFFLQPKDMIYVQPLPRTIFRVNVSDIVTYLSAISTSLALVLAIISINNK